MVTRKYHIKTKKSKPDKCKKRIRKTRSKNKNVQNALCRTLL